MNNEERQHLEELRNNHQKRLRALEIQAASYGIDTPAHISTQIEDARREITNIDSQLSAYTTILNPPRPQVNQPFGVEEEQRRVDSANTVSPRKLQVFLCHSSGDKPAIRGLYQHLTTEGFAPWLDEENLLPGQDWQREIPKAVKNSDVVIVCLSRSSTSKSGYVQKEIKYALDIADELPDDTIFIIPLRLEECEVPERLSRWHWVNAFEERGFDRLLRSLRMRAQTLDIITSQQSTASDSISVMPSKEIAFLTFDSRPLLNEDGKVWQAPYELFPNVADLLNDIYFALDDNVPAFTYEDNWILRDRDTRHVFIDIGTKWSETHHNQRWDERPLSEVGIKPGMYLEIIWPSKKLRLLKSKK
jgi:hypothetical protein